MKTEEVIFGLVAVYKGKDGYGYGTTQTKAVKKEFASLAELRKWVEENGSVDEFSGYGVTTRLPLCSYKTYRMECVESYKRGVLTSLMLITGSLMLATRFFMSFRTCVSRVR